MADISPQLIEKYEKMLVDDPSSQIFAPLSEAYRKAGLLERALNVSRKGVARHPQFASGHVALARVLMDQSRFTEAVDHLLQAVKLSSENILAHSLLAESYTQLKRPKDALKAYKMALLLNPNDVKARNAIKKLESLTADEFTEETFVMGALSDAAYTDLAQDFLQKYLTQYATPSDPKAKAEQLRSLERVLSLVDAFLVRNDLEKAETTLKRAQLSFGDHPDILSRLRLLEEPTTEEEGEAEELSPLPSRDQVMRRRKIQALQNLLGRIEAQRTKVDLTNSLSLK